MRHRLLKQAVILREKGLSLAEISQRLHIAKSTASLWVRDVHLSQIAKNKLFERQVEGRKKAYQVRLHTQKNQIRIFQNEALQKMQTLSYSPQLAKIFCALLWWCEGNKNESFVRFTSSDQSLMRNFLTVFRKGFSLDEKKFRALIHIHKYHDDQKQKIFWSNVTKIPLTQFHKSFKKNNSGKRKHEDYQGCAAVTYYDARIAKELEAIYNAVTVDLSNRGIG